MTKPLISIIIPTYNRANLIGETLDSVLKQTHANWECLIIDDGSVDNTEEFVLAYCKNDERFQYHKRPSNYPKGGNGSRNYGFELSKGNFINWFDDDDIFHPEKLETQVKMLQDSKLNFSVCQVLVFENSISNTLGLRHDKIISNNPLNDYIKLSVIWMTPSALWRKEFLLSLDYLFDLDLKAAQEWEFHTRVLSVNSKYEFTNTPLVYIRKHSQSISYNKQLSLKLYYYFLARLKVYKQLNLSTETNEYLRRFMLDYFKSIVKRGHVKYAFKAFIYFVLKEVKITFISKCYAFFAILSFFVFKKGNLFLKKVTL